MTPAEIKSEADRIEKIITEKGYYAPAVVVYVNWIGYELTINIETRVNSGAPTRNKFIHTTYEAGFADLFVQAEEYVSGLQSIQDAKRDAFIALVAKVIEEGRDIGMEVEFMNPLSAMMEKLSTNILTSQVIDVDVPF